MHVFIAKLVAMSNDSYPQVPNHDTFAPGERVRVMLPLPLSEAYEYRVGADLSLTGGDFVEVPLGRRDLVGVVWGGGAGGIEEGRLRPVSSRVDLPPLPEVSRRFVEWVAEYTVSPPGAVLRMAMSVPEALHAPRARLVYGLATASPLPAALTPARRRVVDALIAGPPRPLAELVRDASVSPAVIRAMVEAGIVVARTSDDQPPPNWRRPGPALIPGQAAAAKELCAAVEGGYRVLVVDGQPGAGKTEVYFEAIAATLAAGRQVLVLLPEIALGAQWLTRFAARLGGPPLVWPSVVGQAVRRRTWRSVLTGEAAVVVGARSALFLPFPNLGLIVVDEEHDGSFKQEDGVAYHARDMAVVRARLGAIPVALVSATPSLETIINARRGRYHLLTLPDRPGAAPLPAIEVVDLTRDRPARGGFVAPSLAAALAETTARGEQALLFLNRRGYAPLTLCRGCGHRMACPACTAWLVEHRLIRRLVCHHCGFAVALPEACPSCGATDTLAACGPGVERLAEEIGTLFPQLRWVMATSDTLTGPREAADLVRRIEAHEVDAIIGTQIVAKGYHFPLLTLVGVIDADLGLSGGDLRAAERTFQLLSQVAGRAGRAERSGRALLQTTMPAHPLMTALAAGDRQRFLAAEEAARAATAMPPFGRLAALILSARDETQVDAATRALAQAAPRVPGVRILGPAPAPLALLRGRHRRRFLVHGGKAVRLSPLIRAWMAQVRLPSAVRIQVDIDPFSFL